MTEQKVETKDQLVKLIKEWVHLDNESRMLQAHLNVNKLEKKRTSNELMEVMKHNEIDCFQIKDGKIQYKKTNIKKPLSNKILVKLLNEFYDGNQDKVSELNNFLIENREEVIKENIVRKMNKEVA
jgi:hypothetical protein